MFQMRPVRLKPTSWREDGWVCPMATAERDSGRIHPAGYQQNRGMRHENQKDGKQSNSMKLIKIGWLCLLALNGAVLSGCAGTEQVVIKDPLGPIGRAEPAAGKTGSLIVYSSWDRFDTLDSEHRKHTPYVIRSEQGDRIIRVRNRSGSFEEDPEVVRLAPGRYWIEARATNLGPIKFAAVIREGEMTVAYLDATTRPGGTWPNGTNWIRQPNGLVIGWKDSGLPPATERASAAP